MNRFIHCNGQIIPADTEIIRAGNRGLRYGDGLFETMKMVNGFVTLGSLHFERLFAGLKTLQIKIPSFLTPEYLSESITQLCEKNNVQQAARIRLMITRGEGSLYTAGETGSCIIIQAEPLAHDYLQLNEKGLTIDIYPDANKSCDILANLKSNNYLPYVMAALYAQQNNLDDCLLLNTYNRICDATIANICWVKAGKIYTPPLSEGCVAGVMRRYLLETADGLNITERALQVEDLYDADEICFTNALFGIRWVKQFRHKIYSNTIITDVYNRYIKNLQTSQP